VVREYLVKEMQAEVVLEQTYRVKVVVVLVYQDSPVEVML
jgi:hypothetical protein